MFYSPNNKMNNILKGKDDVSLYKARHNKVLLSIVMRMLFGCWRFKEASFVTNTTADMKVLKVKL